MKKLVEHIRQTGQIAIIPTDTVYGVVARAADPQSIARLYKLKSREGKPGTLVAASIEQIVELGIERKYLEAANLFWPGAVSVITPCDANLEYIHQGVKSLAFRIPNDPWLLKLLQQTGPLLTSSANQPGDQPATTIDEAKEYFGSQVEWYEDGGHKHNEASTIIKIVDGDVLIIRQGAVNIKLH